MGLCFARLGCVALVLASLGGCGGTKTSQCNQLITIVNRTTDELSALQSNVKSSSQLPNADELGKQLEQFVTSLEKNTKEMESIGVNTELQPYKQKLVTSYKTALNNSRALAVAVKSKNQPAAQTALNALNTASNGEAKLLKEIGNYCQTPQ